MPSSQGMDRVYSTGGWGPYRAHCEVNYCPTLHLSMGDAFGCHKHIASLKM